MSDVTQDFRFLEGIKVVDFTQFEAGTTSTGLRQKGARLLFRAPCGNYSVRHPAERSARPRT